MLFVSLACLACLSRGDARWTLKPWSSHSLHQSGMLHPHLNSPSKSNIDHGGVSGGRKGKAGKRQVPAKSPTSVSAGKKRALEEAEEDEESMRMQVLRFHAYM